jgi:hypothetical protein
VQSKNSSFVSETVQSAFTAIEYRTFQDAYDHFNAALFAGELPQVLITLQRHAHASGYFSRERFQRRNETREHIHEVALNPDSFIGSKDEEILSTLVHEMAHVWQQEFGHPGRGRYHNQEWATKMGLIGLMPSSTGDPGGKMTGDRMSHYIIKNGTFQQVCRTFLQKYRLTWESAGNRVTIRKPPTRSKFTCPNCGLNAWAKPDALMDCHSCSTEVGEPVMLFPAEEMSDSERAEMSHQKQLFRKPHAVKSLDREKTVKRPRRSWER